MILRMRTAVAEGGQCVEPLDPAHPSQLHLSDPGLQTCIEELLASGQHASVTEKQALVEGSILHKDFIWRGRGGMYSTIALQTYSTLET